MTWESELNSGWLAHHGIKGQKWGERRYQNEDGTLTQEGKDRYYDSHSNQWRKSAVRRLNDQELRARNNRLQAERQYRDLTTPQWKKDLREIGKRAVEQIIVKTTLNFLSGRVALRYKDANKWLDDKKNRKIEAKDLASKASKIGSSDREADYLNTMKKTVFNDPKYRTNWRSSNSNFNKISINDIKRK